MSRDSIASHQKFSRKLGLPFPLLSDPDGAVCGKYGVLKEKQSGDTTVMKLVRSTFIVDAGGRIAAEWRNVKVSGHVREVLEALHG